MSFEELIEKQTRNIIADQLDNNDKLEERFGRLESGFNAVLSKLGRMLLEIEALKPSLPVNLELRVARVEQHLDHCATRSQADELFAKFAQLNEAVTTLRRQALDSHPVEFKKFRELEVKVARLEDKGLITRSQVKDIAFETVRDADLDELFGRYVKDKVDEVLDNDEFRDRISSLCTSVLDETEFTVKVK
jgi:hypothetical protein